MWTARNEIEPRWDYLKAYEKGWITNSTKQSQRDTVNITTVETDKAPAPIGPYTQGKEVTGGTTIYVAGQIAMDTSGTLVGDGDISKETTQALTNAGAILEEAGASFDDVVKTTVLLADINDFDAMNAVYTTSFDKSKAARATFAVEALPKGAKVEIEMIAEVSTVRNQTLDLTFIE